ncbi:riboflavin synthase [Pontimonas salivibrio]|uniref:Riboflavin synthase n=1 Tax=Pontimonas salivibrio TaxID=1159327 RepID=A0A2L2BSG6_9MICO|nr:riboflavin synthase [Pontimonas salivibrio]AVG24616.1 riboflavin synthase [Pontimonas salivibrio]
MFTGLIEEMGSVVERVPSGDGERISISASVVLEDVSHGDSIAVSGVCLTVVESTPQGFIADVMAETIRQSSLSMWVPGTPVNLERAAALGDRLGGHIVQGHVDATATVLEVTPGDQWSVLRFSLDETIAELVAMKGSICVDGVSLTVSAVGRDWFEVSLIPETLSATTLGALGKGDTVNIETDILARQVQRMLQLREGVEV